MLMIINIFDTVPYYTPKKEQQISLLFEISIYDND